MESKVIRADALGNTKFYTFSVYATDKPCKPQWQVMDVREDAHDKVPRTWRPCVDITRVPPEAAPLDRHAQHPAGW